MRTMAERLGVTKTTISLALRDHPSISKAMREKVNLLAREVNYRPDPAISAIAAQRWCASSPMRHRVIAFLCHHHSTAEHILSAYLPAAKERAEELGYKLEPFYLDDYPSADAVSRVLYNRGIRGLLIPQIMNPESKRVMRLNWEKFTGVCCGVGRVRPPLHTVTTDHFMTTRLVWEVAAKSGYKRIGASLHCHDPIADDDWQRIGASSAAIKLLQLSEAAEIPILTADVLDEKSLVEWYHRYKPELIIGFNQRTGEILERNNIRMPEDVEFISLMAGRGSKWSGILHHYDQISRISVEVLTNELRDNRWGLPELSNNILVRPEWHHGTTFRGDDFAEHYTISTVSAHSVGHNVTVGSGKEAPRPTVG